MRGVVLGRGVVHTIGVAQTVSEATDQVHCSHNTIVAALAIVKKLSSVLAVELCKVHSVAQWLLC